METAARPNSYNAIWIASLWAGLAILDATQNVFAMRHEGMHHAWTKMFIVLTFEWLPWALVTPMAIWLGRRHPPAWKSPQTWLVHICSSSPSMSRRAGHELYVRIPDIDWIEAADYYVCLHVGPKSHLLRRSMAELERDLDAHIFCRIHRSTIVNLRRVRALQIDNAGEYEVLLDSGQK